MTVTVPERDGSARASGGASVLGRVVFGAVAAGWVVVLALVARHRIYVSHDSVSNYAHVWYVADRLRHAHLVPFRMPLLGHGKAFTFPYGFLPWLTAGVAWLGLGSWAVTLWLVLASAGLVAATFWAFPELRPSWSGAAALANPAVVIGLIVGQLPFVSASALLLAGVGCWRRGRRWQAALLVALGQATHPAIVLPIGLGLVVGRLWWERDRRALLAWYGVALLLSAPAAWLVIASPVFVDSSVWTKFVNFVATIGVRMCVVLVPVFAALMGAVATRWRRLRWVVPGGFLLVASLNVVFYPLLNLRYAWTALDRTPNTTMLKLVDSPAFERELTYRVLRAGDGKIGMYQVLVNGGRLDSEFFPESIDRRSFGDVATYSAFLRSRHVDMVIVWDTFDRKFRTDEHALLDRLTSTSCSATTVHARLAARLAHAWMYRITRRC